MDIVTQTAGTSLERFVRDVRDAWSDPSDATLPFTVKALMDRLVAAATGDEPWVARLVQDGLPARELYRDPERGFLLMGHIHKGGHANAPHNHGPCWVLYGVGRGEIEITTYRRTDDGRVPGRATLEVKDRTRLTPGVVRPYLPGDIHSTRAVDPVASLVFRFLSADLDRVERDRYDLEKGTVVRQPRG